MLNRRITRVLLNTTEVTDSLKEPGGSLAAVLLTTDSLYIGFHGKFGSRYLEIGTVNTVASVLSVAYWDGDSWESVDDLIDQTSVGGKTFARDGFISWTNKTDWLPRNLTGTDADLELFWVRLTVSVNLSAGTTLQSILNLFSDDDFLSVYYPELVSDTNFLPTGQTNFMHQHLAAKDLVILRLKQRQALEDEAQIVDINDVSVAAVHGTAWLIYKAIATSPDMQALRDSAKAAFDEEIGNVTFAVDLNEDGIVSDTERTQLTSVNIYRR